MNLKQCIALSTDILSECSETPALDARVLIKECFGLSDTELVTKSNNDISEDMLQELDETLVQRQQHVPVAYIIGHKDFWRDTYYTPNGVLIPRPDTETVAEKAVNSVIETKAEKTDISILDLCAGTGCLGITVAKELAIKGFRVTLSLSDISEQAYDSFSVNADNILWGLDVDVLRFCGNLFEALKGTDINYDLIVCNPPYICSSLIESLSDDVKSEPVIALDGGSDGLDFYRKIIPESLNYLKIPGILVMEIGYDQAFSVKKLFEVSGFKNIDVFKGLDGNDRVVKGLIQ